MVAFKHSLSKDVHLEGSKRACLWPKRFEFGA